MHSYEAASARELDARAERAEHSPLPAFLKVGRFLVWALYAIVSVIAILLTLAFFLRLAGANPDAGFVEWVYRSVDRAMRPFRGIFPDHEVGGASVLDFSLLFAAIVYFFSALLVDVLLNWLTHRIQMLEQDAANLRVQADVMAHRAAASADLAARQLAAQEAVAETAARVAAGTVAQSAAPAPPVPGP